MPVGLPQAFFGIPIVTLFFPHRFRNGYKHVGKIHRVGIIGCGKVARHHMAAYQNLPNASLVAVCDMDRAKAEALTERAANVSVCTDVDQLCAAGVEVASVCTPHPW